MCASRLAIFALAAATALFSSQAQACSDHETEQCFFGSCVCVWDPSKGPPPPPPIPRNPQELVEWFGKMIEKGTEEIYAQQYAPALEQALIASRNTAYPHSSPLPQTVRQKLQGFFDAGTLDAARYKIGDSGAVNLANLSINYGDATAVTLIDVIVFQSAQDTQNLQLWAHELAHVQQFRSWGTRDFAIRYLRDWNAVEHEANQTDINYANWLNQQQSQTPAPPGPQWPGQPQYCIVPGGSCILQFRIPPHSPCYCQSWNGQAYYGQSSM